MVRIYLPILVVLRIKLLISTIDIWNIIYTKLYGGFEDLSKTALSDELEIDELANVPKHKLTKEGYLKDGFVVDKVIRNNNNKNTRGDDESDEDYVESEDNISDVGSDWSDLPDEDKKQKNKNIKKKSTHKQPIIQTPILQDPIVIEELTSEPYI